MTGVVSSPASLTEPEAGGRKRQGPGLKTASIAFFLTVLLGIGGTAAHAYWSQKAEAILIVATARPTLPVLTGTTRCEQRNIGSIVYIQYTPPQLPPGASILVSVTAPGNPEPLQFAVENTGSFALRNLPGLDQFIGGSFFGKRIYVSVTAAYLSSIPSELPGVVELPVLAKAEAGRPAEAVFRYTYFC